MADTTAERHRRTGSWYGQLSSLLQLSHIPCQPIQLLQPHRPRTLLPLPSQPHKPTLHHPTPHRHHTLPTAHIATARCPTANGALCLVQLQCVVYGFELCAGCVLGGGVEGGEEVGDGCWCGGGGCVGCGEGRGVE